MKRAMFNKPGFWMRRMQRGYHYKRAMYSYLIGKR